MRRRRTNRLKTSARTGPPEHRGRVEHNASVVEAHRLAMFVPELRERRQVPRCARRGSMDGNSTGWSRAARIRLMQALAARRREPPPRGQRAARVPSADPRRTTDRPSTPATRQAKDEWRAPARAGADQPRAVRTRSTAAVNTAQDSPRLP